MNRYFEKLRMLYTRLRNSNKDARRRDNLNIDYSQIDPDDRKMWDSVWANQSHRRIEFPLRLKENLSLSHFDIEYGLVTSATISQDPIVFSDRCFRETEKCPICGMETVEVERIAASVHPQFENGINCISFGVWVHKNCFQSCSVIDGPSPIPW